VERGAGYQKTGQLLHLGLHADPGRHGPPQIMRGDPQTRFLFESFQNVAGLLPTILCLGMHKSRGSSEFPFHSPTL